MKHEEMFFITGEPQVVVDARRQILRAFEDLEFYGPMQKKRNTDFYLQTILRIEK